MLFTQLLALLSQQDLGSVSLAISKSGDELIVLLVPKTNKTGDDAGALAQPLQLTGTAAELDQEFIGLLSKFTSRRASLAEQLEATEQVLEAAKTASAGKAGKALAKAPAVAKVKPTAPSPATEVQEPGAEDDDDNAGAGEAESYTPEAAASAESNLFA